MSESVIPTVVEQMLVLPDDVQRQVLNYLQNLRATLHRGAPGKQLVQFAGLIAPEDLDQMQQAIERDCEQVDNDEW
jgi:hypothetical protein